MSEHVDTIRFGLPPLGAHTVLIREQGPLEEAHAALDALAADNQCLRDALELALNFHTLARTPDDEVLAQLRAALDETCNKVTT